MVGKRDSQAHCSRGELVLWTVFVAIGFYLLAVGVIPAAEAEQRQSRELERQVRKTESLERERRRLSLRRQALQNDIDFVEYGIREQGYLPEGAIRVVEAPEEAPVEPPVEERQAPEVSGR